MVFPHFALLPHKKVLDNVEYGLRIAGTPRRESRERSHAMIEIVGLKGWANSLPDALSGGMRQRVGIARALACDPEILLMDEPFGALDPLIRRDMQQELRALQKKFNKTIVFITHDLDEAMQLGDRVAIMRDGKFVQMGTPEEILVSPEDDYVADFTRDVNRGKAVSVMSVAKDVATVSLKRASLRLLASMKDDVIYLVEDDGRLTGALRRIDALVAIRAGKTDISHLIIKDVPQVLRDTKIEDTYSLFKMSEFVAVVDEEKKLYGGFSARDLASYLAEKNIPSLRRDVAPKGL